MKKLLITIITILYSTLLFSQSFYQYKGKRIDLKVDSTMFVIQSSNHLVGKQNKALEEQLQKGEIKLFKKIPNNRFLVVGAKHQIKDYGYLSDVYRNNRNSMVIILPRIVIMFKQEIKLSSVLNKYAGKLVKEGGDSQKYILKCNVSQSEEVLQLVNELDSRDDVIWCEPEFLSEYKIENTLYSQQYYLNNTGQDGGIAGIDINVEPAWNITNGNSNITVAVVDVGVDRTHEDMSPRVLEGFTIRNTTGKGEPQNANSLDLKYHGVACAGIVAASNNTIGIRGVASNANVLPVNIVPDAAYIDWLGRAVQGFGSNIEIAEAINWAWHRADVLSCSWGGGEPSNDVTLAIDSARTYGRNGKGSVVVFSSGNNYPDLTDVSYPSSVDGVITVGAITNRGVICNYSQRGTSMDLVAPTGDINSDGNVTTTDRMGSLGDNNGNYMDDFGGTSAACPQVAGVAALMLSVNPNLTETEVKTILQQTAIDMGSSGFDNTYGYGRVNAHNAVLNAFGGNIAGTDVVCTSNTTFSLTGETSGLTFHWQCSTNLLAEVSDNDDPTYVVKAKYSSSSGAGWVKVTISNGFEDEREITKTVWVGRPNTPIITSDNVPSYIWTTEYGYPAAKKYTVYMYNDIAFSDENETTYGSLVNNFDWTWYLDDGGNMYQAYDDYGVSGIMYIFEEPGVYRIRAKSSNNCSTTDYSNPVYVEVVDEMYLLVFSPNPSTIETTISIEQGGANGTPLKSASTETTFDENAEWDLEVYDNAQSLKLKKQKLKGRSARINTQNWKDGVYMVRVKYKDEILTAKLVVKQ